MNLQLSKTAFWDTDMREMDEEKHAWFIITRVFQYGLLDDIRAVLKRYDAQIIREAFKHTRGVDEKAKDLAVLLISNREK